MVLPNVLVAVFNRRLQKVFFHLAQADLRSPDMQGSPRQGRLAMPEVSHQLPQSVLLLVASEAANAARTKLEIERGEKSEPRCCSAAAAARAISLAVAGRGSSGASSGEVCELEIARVNDARVSLRHLLEGDAGELR